MTLQEFANIFAPLTIQLRQTDADEATIRVYFEALKDLEVEFVAMGAARMAQQGGSFGSENPHWFPKTSEWRAMAAKVEAERLDAQRARLRKLPAPLCLACSDTGWMRDLVDRVHPCECRTLRRLELLGRRPAPTPAIGPVPETTDGPLLPVASEDRIRVIRESLRTRLARLEDAAQSGRPGGPSQGVQESNDAAARSTEDHSGRTT